MTVVAVACIAAWLGIMAFFSFGVAPLAFAMMERTAAGQVVAAVLPRYYITGLGLCAVALVVYAAQAAGGRGGRLRPLAGVVLCAAMMGMLAWAATVLTPQAEAARRTRDDIAFARAHRASVTLNGVTMLAAVAVLALEGVRRAPKAARPPGRPR
ncbi:MAG TPA: DUF4149 domain-containing protein [Candidatus Limnocylindria bacterium]|nr:DUF4149 domain-containing protein [Candidatus Limnocylindria bacterium]